MNVESGFELGDLVGIVQRRARAMIWTALGGVLVAFWIAMLLPNEYESYATILVEPQTVSRELVESGVGETDLIERLGLMTAQILSRPRLSDIIERMELYSSESEYMLHQEVIDLMRESIRVEPVVPELERDTRRDDAVISTFRIFYSHEQSATAAEVSQELANNFIEEHIRTRVNTSQKSLDFMNTELNRLADQISQLEARISEVKGANRGRLPEDLSSNQIRLERLSGQLSYAQRELAEAGSDEAYYRNQQSAADLASPMDVANPRRRLKLLELELSEMRARGYTAKHPDIVKTELELATIQERLRTEKVDVEEDDREPMTFARQALDSELRRAILKRESAESEVARLEGLAQEFEEQIGRTPEVAEQLDALQREYEHLFGSYQDFSNRRLEATVQAQLERRQLGEQFRVIEAAFEATEPTSPHRILILALGIFFGLALGAGVGILLESADPSVHTPRQLQDALRIPVLATIPQIWLESDQVARRRKRFRNVAAAMALVVVNLAGGGLTYVWVNGTGGSALRSPLDVRGADEAPVDDALPDLPGPDGLGG